VAAAASPASTAPASTSPPSTSPSPAPGASPLERNTCDVSPYFDEPVVDEVRVPRGAAHLHPPQLVLDAPAPPRAHELYVVRERPLEPLER